MTETPGDGNGAAPPPVGESPIGRVLIIAGSDSGGGAGIQADIKAVTVLGAYAMTAITAITVQNTLGMQDVHPVPVEIVRAQIRAVLDDIGTDAVKTGMLHSTAVIDTVAEEIDARATDAHVVVDPVMVAKGGAHLIEQSALDALKLSLLPMASLITPNVPEAEILTGHEIGSLAGQKSAAEALLRQGVQCALIKGGHLAGETVHDVLATQDELQVFSSPRIDTQHTHGTGCTLASAIAAGLAQGFAMAEAVDRARTYVHEAIRQAPGLGHGHGPLNHLPEI